MEGKPVARTDNKDLSLPFLLLSLLSPELKLPLAVLVSFRALAIERSLCCARLNAGPETMTKTEVKYTSNEVTISGGNWCPGIYFLTVSKKIPRR